MDSQLVALLTDHSRRNPRSIKRLINGFVLEAGLNPLWQDFGPEAAIRTLLLLNLYPDFYRTLVGSNSIGVDAVTEFLEYRQVRQYLRQHHTPAEPDQALLRRVFAQHEVIVDLSRLADQATGREQALADLEQQLPSDFPRLVLDRSFTSLVEDLTRLPDSAALLQRLQQQPLTLSPQSTHLEETPAPTAWPIGISIVWIDDHPRPCGRRRNACREGRT
ncbi:hypothetical protein GXW82_13520 [Streptacidiphilus sp. 4-A2]|nr:hypothetical protein [Streptacidiphilus sp. 4-A2]